MNVKKVAMWKLFLYVFSSITLQVLCGKLVGDHICLTEESYTVNVTEHYVRNATVRNYQWCLHVPPRCSFYTIKKVNDTRIVEKLQRRTVEKCCEGFYEKHNECVSYCEDCVNGICYKQACQCSPGYSGENCDNICQSGFWGPNCTKQCDCEDQLCNPVNGSCKPFNNDKTTIKPYLDETGTTKTETIKSTDNSDYKPITDMDDISKSNQEISQINSNYINPLTANEITTHTNSFDVISEHDVTTNEPSEKDVITLITVTASPNQITSKGEEDVSFSNTTNLINNNSEHRETTHSKDIFKMNIEDDTHFNDNFLNRNKEFLIPVAIKYDQITRPLSQRDTKMTTESSISEERNFLVVDDHDRHKSSQDNNLIKSIGVSVATTISLIILAIVLLAIDHNRRAKKKKEENTNTKKNVEVSTVSIYATSIFHTPLPDPPTFENPSYLTPMEYQNGITEPRTFEPHVVYNMNLENQPKTDCRNSVYDHPPSTGSYRAASIIEPLDIDHKPPVTQIEPVYDEIPCRGIDANPYCNQPLSLYINTCGRTSF